MATKRGDHRRLAEALRRRITTGPGETEARLRAQAAARAMGGAPLEAPFDALARQIGEASRGVTDEQVSLVHTRLGSDKAAFELIAAAAVGAGLYRWDRALAAIEGPEDAAG